MNLNIDELKNKIIYRSNYRGTKEMDILLSLFTKKIINELDFKDLIKLSKLLDVDDENLYKFKQGLATTVNIEINKISLLFKEFNYNKK
jgi:antitoxin CptB